MSKLRKARDRLDCEWLDRDRTAGSVLADLHARVCRRDPDAVEQLAELSLRTLRGHLRRAFPRTSPDVLHDSVTDALMDYVAHPECFTPATGQSLWRLLYQAAWRNAADHLRRETRRQRREIEYGHSLPAATAETLAAIDTRRDIDIVLRCACGAERDALRLWLSGERRTVLLAAALGHGSAVPAEQRRLIKQFKDRMIKRIARQAHRSVHALGQ